MSAEFNLHYPTRTQRFLEKIGLREITPADICPSQFRDAFYGAHPDLLGDRTAIGPGDDGYCQSWRGNPGWWKELVK